MNKTKIDWTDSSWNPVTGCLHDCSYCYARGIARRFAGFEPRYGGEVIPEGEGTCPGSIRNTTHGKTLHVFDRQPKRRLLARGYPNGKFVATNYPYNFEPTLHRHKMNEFKKKSDRTIFVCSMADLFGEWVPDEWISEVFEACAAAPQHRYLFLTKNPARYAELYNKGLLPLEDNFWYGQTITGEHNNPYITPNHYSGKKVNTFVSCEPVLGDFDINFYLRYFGWIIIGRATGIGKCEACRQEETIRTAIRHIRCSAETYEIPVFMKDNLISIVGEENMLRQYPWEVSK